MYFRVYRHHMSLLWKLTIREESLAATANWCALPVLYQLNYIPSLSHDKWFACRDLSDPITIWLAVSWIPSHQYSTARIVYKQTNAELSKYYCMSQYSPFLVSLLLNFTSFIWRWWAWWNLRVAVIWEIDGNKSHTFSASFGLIMFKPGVKIANRVSWFSSPFSQSVANTCGGSHYHGLMAEAKEEWRWTPVLDCRTKSSFGWSWESRFSAVGAPMKGFRSARPLVILYGKVTLLTVLPFSRG